jgi:hypothetical protein
MRILLANLKHLYQRRGLWIVYAGLALVVWFWSAFSVTKGQVPFGGFLLGSFLLGVLVATLQMETSSKPLSFCLPGHRRAVRRLVLLVGLVVSFVFLLVGVALLAVPSFARSLGLSFMPPRWLILVLGAYFCASVTAYLLAAGVVFTGMQSALSFMVLVVSMCVMFDVFPPIQYPILHWPAAVMALALVVGLGSWWWLGRRAWFRRSCATPWIGFFDPWDRSQIQKYRSIYAARVTKNIPPGLDLFFQRAIGTRRPSSPSKYAWGVLYTTCVLVGPQWKWLLTFAVLTVTCTAYFPPMAPGVISVVFFMMTGFVQPPLCTAWLVAGGRKERFFATVALILALGVVSALLVGVLAGLTHLLAPLAPPIRWKGLTLAPHALSFQVLAIPLVLLPVVGLLQTLFYRKPVWLALSIMLVLTLIMVSSMPLSLYQVVTPALAVGGTVLSWAVCVSILYRIAMKSDLARQ